MAVREWIDRTLYPGHGDRWDFPLFRAEVESTLKKTDVLLDLGAGAGLSTWMNFKGKVTKVWGIDPDPRVLTNRFLDEASVGTGEALPFVDGQFDVVIAHNVLEHLVHPKKVFQEVSRVLKPGGIFLVKTPNRWHYVPVVARLTPHWFHRWYYSLKGNAEDDAFPTLYRCNSVRVLETLAQESGLDVISISRTEGRPEYLRIFWPLYLIGVLYERLVNSLRPLRRFRVLLIGKFQKPGYQDS